MSAWLQKMKVNVEIFFIIRRCNRLIKQRKNVIEIRKKNNVIKIY